MAYDNSHFDIVKYLLDQGASIETYCEKYGDDCRLFFACVQGNLEMVKVLDEWRKRN